MKIQVDDIVRKAVEDSGITRKAIYTKMGLSREWLRRLLDNPEMEEDYVVKIGKIISYDFSKHFPELRGRTQFVANDANETYKNLNNEELRMRLLELQEKYIHLLEEHVMVLKQLNQGLNH